jgi:hypothetical protein
MLVSAASCRSSEAREPVQQVIHPLCYQAPDLLRQS